MINDYHSAGTLWERRARRQSVAFLIITIFYVNESTWKVVLFDIHNPSWLLISLIIMHYKYNMYIQVCENVSLEVDHEGFRCGYDS